MKLLDIFKSSPILENIDSTINEVGIDNIHGMGAVPKNQDIDYFGLRVFMKPKTFLSLAHLARPDAGSTDKIKAEIQSGKTIAAPFLTISIPQEWKNGDFSIPATVDGHEGRNRMWAVFELDGNDPIEVHIMPRGFRARDLKPEWINRIKAGLIAQGTHTEIKGPLFVVGEVNEELNEVYPGQSSGKLKNYVKRKYGGEINCTKAAKVKADPDASSFYKKRASWYQSLHCRGKKKKTTESKDGRPSCCDDC